MVVKKSRIKVWLKSIIYDFSYLIKMLTGSSDYYLARAIQNYKSLDHCIDFLDKSIHKNPNNISAIEWRVRSKLEIYAFNEEIFFNIMSDIKKIERIKKDVNSILIYSVGLAYERLYSYHMINRTLLINEGPVLLERAKKAYLEYLKFEPNDSHTLLSLAGMVMDEGDYLMAENYYSKIIETKYDEFILDYNIYEKRAQARAYQKKYDLAIEDVSVEINIRFTKVVNDLKEQGSPIPEFENYNCIDVDNSYNIVYILPQLRQAYLLRAKYYYESFDFYNHYFSMKDVLKFIELCPTNVKNELKDLSTDYPTIQSFMKANCSRYILPDSFD